MKKLYARSWNNIFKKKYYKYQILNHLYFGPNLVFWGLLYPNVSYSNVSYVTTVHHVNTTSEKQKHPPGCSIKKCVLESLDGSWKMAWGLQLYLKRDSGTSIFLWVLQNFQERLLCRTLPDDCFWKKKISFNKSWLWLSL